MSTLEQVIEESTRMLEWEDDWDGEGSVAYTPEAWARGVRVARYLVECGFPVPRIHPGPDGGIDLSWYTYLGPGVNRPVQPMEFSEDHALFGLMFVDPDTDINQSISFSFVFHHEDYTIEVQGGTK